MMTEIASRLGRVISTVCMTVVVFGASVVVDRTGVVTLIADSVAQESRAKKKEKTRKTPALRNNIYEKLAEAQTFAEAKDYASAEEILNEMLDATSKKSKLNAYELANVYNTYAFLRYAVEDYNGALNYYQKVIDQRPQIPVALEVGTLFTIAQLHFLQENWQKGIDTLNQWMAVTEIPNTNAYVLLANGYFQLKD